MSNNFKVGDTVVFTDRSGAGFGESVSGKQYRVTKVYDSGEYLELDDEHTCYYRRVAIVPKAPDVVPVFNIGDTVRVKTGHIDDESVLIDQHNTNARNCFVKEFMGEYQGLTAKIEGFDSGGYTLSLNDGYGWMPQWLELVEQKDGMTLNEALAALEKSEEEVARLKAIISQASAQLAEI